jgi:uncharacterized protein (TIGR00725 family)
VYPAYAVPVRQLSVFGAGDATPEQAVLAEEVGRLVAAAGVALVTGGLGGVMEAASRGAAGVGGVVIAVLPGTETAEANTYATAVVATGVGQGRNLAVAASGEAAIAIGHGYGTLSEIALARKLGRRVVVLDGPDVPGTDRATSAADAVERALRRP